MGGGRASCATPPLANAAEPLAVADACRSENAKPMAPILHYEIRKCDASAPAGGQFDFHEVLIIERDECATHLGVAIEVPPGSNQPTVATSSGRSIGTGMNSPTLPRALSR